MTYHTRQRNTRIAKEVQTAAHKIEVKLNTLVIKISALNLYLDQSEPNKTQLENLRKTIRYVLTEVKGLQNTAEHSEAAFRKDAADYRKKWQDEKRRKQNARKRLAKKEAKPKAIKTNPLEGVDNSLD